MKNEYRTFEDCIEIINAAIRKQKSRWQLDSINWFDFDDIEQIIRSHINEKWHMWDQSRPLEPWINIIIRNQIKNQVRNHYGNYLKPCMTCPFAVGENGCSVTASRNQDSQCIDYQKWELRKKNAFDLKLALSTENHDQELKERPCNNFCYDKSVDKLNEQMKKVLSQKNYKAYYMLYFEKASEEEVAKFMGYKTNEKKRKAGYRQVKNLKKLFIEKAKEIIKEFDIIVDEIKF